MKRFILLLRQLASEFDAFGDTAEGRAVFAELETIRLPLKLRGLRDRAAHGHRGHLPQGREPRPSRARSGSAPSRDAGVVADAGCGGTNAPGQPALARGHEALRRHQTTARTLRRAGRPIRHPRVRPTAAGGRLPRSYRMERLQRAVRHRTVVRRQRRSAGADRAPGRHRPQPAALAQAERRLRAAAGAAEPAPREVRRICSKAKSSGGGSFTVGWICSFSLPIITICAFICLNIFLSLFDLIFRWMFFIKICIPFPKRSES